jgi:hypothetical protein
MTKKRKFVKSLNCLKQTPRQMNKMFDNVMFLKNKFKINKVDKCVYIRNANKCYANLCIYVNNMLILSNWLYDQVYRENIN